MLDGLDADMLWICGRQFSLGEGCNTKYDLIFLFMMTLFEKSMVFANVGTILDWSIEED